MRKSRNRVLSYLMVLSMLVLTLAGCSSKDKKSDTPEATQAPAATEAPTEAPADASVNEALSGKVREDLTALELVKLMGNGINLGNTMEACDTNGGYKEDISAYETMWEQPVTTQAIIDGMKAAGFDTLRIPVAWVTNAMNGFKDGDYTIRKEYLDRVEEIVNYALKNNMYVIINDHWDGGWWGMFGSATQATRDAAMELYTSMWTQIAERFKDYSDYVIFEAGNEELGNRFNDKDVAADSGTLSEDECYKLNTKVNQAFVDTVRKTGGNNAQRFLLIAGYNTDIEKTCDDRFTMPTDTAKDKLLLSVHYYTPWGYAGTTSLSSWGTVRDYNEQNDLLAKMTKYTDQGYGVIIGEYMVALNQDGSVKNNACDFFNNFLNNCDMYGYVPVLWDCSTMYKRTDCAIFDKDVADLFKNRSLAAQASLSEEEIKANAKAAMDAALAAATDKTEETAIDPALADKAIAWIMFNSGDWSITYSVGDTYTPESKTDGLVPTDVEITGPGTYTVGLDFTGTAGGFANGIVFSAIGISNGEILYPGYIIDIKEVLVNGEKYELLGKPYTTVDDGKCTRVNLYNMWVNSIPDSARTADGDTSDVSACVMDPNLGNIKTLSITFDYGPAE